MRYEAFTQAKAESIIRLWNKELFESFPLRKELFFQNTIQDENLFLHGSFLCIDEKEETVIGFIITKVWQKDDGRNLFPPQTGWIQAILVDKEYRKVGIGSKLLSLAETALTQKGIKRILVGADYLHYFPGIPEQEVDTQRWFEKKSYQAGNREVDLAGHFDDSYKWEPDLEEGVSYTLLEKENANELIFFLHRCFPGRWEYEAMDYFARGGTGREFVVLRKNEKLIGFCRINDPLSPFIAQNINWSPLFPTPLGGIGPLGIDESERGNGFGHEIVKAGVHFLVQRGIKDIVIDWTGLISFYQKAGFQVWKSYKGYSKDLV